MNRIAGVVLLAALLAARADAHGIHHKVTHGDTIVVELTHAGGAPFAGARYQVFRPGESGVFQSGVTDPRGRIAFVPDHEGGWRVRAFSEDGHGVDLVVEAAPPPTPAGVSTGAPADAPADTAADAPVEATTTDSRRGRGARIVMGVVAIFAIFGGVALFLRKPKR